MREAGYASGMTLNMMVSEQAAREARAMASQWKKIGVELSLKVVPMSEIFLEWGRPEKRWDVFGNLCPDPMGHVAFIYGLGMYSKSPFGGYQDADFDRLFERMLAEVEEEEHHELARRVDRYIHEKAMGVFTYQRMKVYGLRAHVKAAPHLSGSVFLRTVDLR